MRNSAPCVEKPTLLPSAQQIMLQCHIRVIECCDAHVRASTPRHRDLRPDQQGIRADPEPRGAGIRRQAAPQVRIAPPGIARAARATPERVRLWRQAGFPRGDEIHPRRRLESRGAAEGHARPARRDHRAHRSQDGDQRAQLRRVHLHGGLRGRELPDLAQHDRRAAQPARTRCVARSASSRAARRTS